MLCLPRSIPWPLPHGAHGVPQLRTGTYTPTVALEVARLQLARSLARWLWSRNPQPTKPMQRDILPVPVENGKTWIIFEIASKLQLDDYRRALGTTQFAPFIFFSLSLSVVFASLLLVHIRQRSGDGTEWLLFFCFALLLIFVVQIHASVLFWHLASFILPPANGGSGVVSFFFFVFCVLLCWTFYAELNQQRAWTMCGRISFNFCR